ncbi:MAG: thiamine pyrophosphate protein central region [Candidatus Aramenus sulfurataquae]|uniref:2-oxoacid oxidoreductase (ferredoxin) n=2 Tax=Candidatus Aramenus sulfurataquae TaxID=1326980 RepID=W7KJ62_9CREN|nr:MAG: thiamine pyrophosphate protein central region [Candidatus Aramenus sulfurataquae]MCL7343234.1 thiamine pyrophosphate-binding protein [Candidatus Aramenus sulfurataquae]
MSQPKRKEETVGREMTGDEALAYVIKEIGVTKVFTTTSLPEFLAERLKQYGIFLDVSLSPREALLGAYTYAMENNTIGTVVQIPGTPLLEGTSVIAQAFSDSVPLLIVSSIRSYRDVGKSRIGELRTNDDMSSILAPITKIRERAVSIEEVTVNVEKCYKEALSNRPRPAYVEIAEDLFKLKAYPLSPAEQKPEKKTPDKTTVAKVAEVLANSKSPVIIAGYGVISSGATKELVELAELLKAPVITTIRAKGAIPASNPLFAGEGLGVFGTDVANKLLSEADAILILGSRLTQLSTGGWSMKLKGFVMHNNIDGEDIGKVIMPQQPIVADAGLFLKELLALLKQKNLQRSDEAIKTIMVNKKTPTLRGHGGIWPYDVVRLLQQFEFDKVFVDLSAVTFDSIRLPVNGPVWFTSESIIEKGIGVMGVLQSSFNSLGIVDVETAYRNLGAIMSRRKSVKGTIVIFNDEGATYLDSSKSDMPTIGKSSRRFNIDKELESLGAVTVDTYSQLKDALKKRDVNGLNIINVKIDPEYESVVLFRPS